MAMLNTTYKEIMSQPDTISLLVQLISQSLNLEEGRVRRYNQRAKLPQIDNLYIDIAYLTAHIFGNNAYAETDPVTGNYNWVQVLNRKETYALNLFSVNSDAYDYLNQVLFCFKSDLANQFMDQYNFQIAPITSDPQDLSAVEGPAELTRIQFHVTILRGYTQTTTINYYDQFPGTPALITQP